MKRDAWIAGALFIVAALLGTRYTRSAAQHGARFASYDFSYGPAIMVACGRGYVAPAASRIPALDAFLESRSDAFDCSALPPSVPTVPLSGFQRTFRSLMWTVGGVWRLTGVSWTGLAPLSGVLFGLTVALAYACLRLVARRLLAAIGATLILTSPLHLAYLSNFRDYPKAPIMLAIGFTLGAMLRRESPRFLMALAVLFAAVLGIGIGFRQDVLVALPAFLFVMIVLLPGPWRSNAKQRISAAAAAVVVFLLAASPQLAAYSPGGGASVLHVAMLGLMSPFDRSLGVSNDGLYEWGYYDEDSFAYATLAGHAERLHRGNSPIAFYGREYDAAAQEYFIDFARTFPADLITRAYASTVKLIELPSSTRFASVPPYLDSTWAARAWALRAALLERTHGWWLIAAAAAVASVGARDLRLALGLIVLLVYTLGFPAVQFHERHFFYLDVVPIAAAAWVLESVVGLARAGWPAIDRRRLTRAAAGVVLGFALLTVPLSAARQYQDRRVDDLLRGYLTAPRETVALAPRPIGESAVALAAAGGSSMEPADTGGIVRSELYAVTVGGPRCDAGTVALTLRYAVSRQDADFSRRLDVAAPMDGRQSVAFIPAFAYGAPSPSGAPVGFRFVAVEVPRAAFDCVDGVERIAAITDVPVLVGAMLPPDWEQAAKHQTIDDWESRRPLLPDVVTSPPGVPVSPRRLLQPAASIEPWLAERARVVRVLPSGDWIVQGRGGLGGDGRSFYLARTRPTELAEGSLLAVSGELRRGGLSVGLIRDGRWVGQAAVVRAGRFVAVVRVPATGRYEIVLANALSRFASNDFTLTRMGVIP